MKALSRLTPALLRAHPQFRRFWTGQTVSLIGDQVTFIALPLVAVLVLDASAAQMGYLTAAALIPNLLFSLHAGAFVDRRGHRRQLMILADVGRGLLLALVPLTAALGVLSLPVLYVVAFLTGSLSVLFMVAYSALFVALVPRDGYVGAQSLLNGSRALASVVGPSLGGMLVQALTAPLAIAVDAVSYAVSAAYLLRVRVVEPPCEEERRGLSPSGVRFIARSPIVRPALLATATLNFFDYAFLALFVLYATRSLGVAPGTLGVVLGAGAVGAVIGAAVTGRAVRRIGVGPVFVVGCVLFPASLLLVPLAGGPHAVVLLCLLARGGRRRAGRDDAGHQHRLGLRGGGPRPLPLARLRRLHGGQLRGAPPGVPGRGRAGDRHRHPRDAVDRRRRRHAGRALAGPLAAAQDAGAAGGRGGGAAGAAAADNGEAVA